MNEYERVTRNTAEVVTEEELRDIIEQENPHAYLGYATTGFMHTGHMIPVFKIHDFLKAGFTFTFLLADLHAYLDDEKTPWELLDARAECYELCVRGLLDAFGIGQDRIRFVQGSDFELDDTYVLDVLQMMGDVTINRARRAASEVVRFQDNPPLGGFAYPLFQIEDCVALDVDVALGGIDQRGIYMLGRELLEKEDKYTCVFTPLLPGLTGEKMSASDEKSKIGLLDSEEEVREKLNDAYCPAGDVEDNGVTAFCKHLIFPLLSDRDEAFTVQRDEEYGGDLVYDSYEELEKDFIAEELHPLDLKEAVADVVNELLDPVRERFQGKHDLLEQAYPDRF